MTPMSGKSSAADSIRALGARVTPMRRRVLELLRSSPEMLTHQEIAGHLGADVPVDRVTLYRVLDWLVEHELAHRTIDEARVFRYAAAGGASGHGEHPHFRCDTCGGVFCLDTMPLAVPHLPRGFRSSHVEVSIHGECSRCAPAAVREGR